MERWNSEGIRRDELLYTLKNKRMVMAARRIDRCLLCKNPKLNEAGLCDVCYSTLDGEELNVAFRWLAGLEI